MMFLRGDERTDHRRGDMEEDGDEEAETSCLSECTKFLYEKVQYKYLLLMLVFCQGAIEVAIAFSMHRDMFDSSLVFVRVVGMTLIRTYFLVFLGVSAIADENQYNLGSLLCSTVLVLATTLDEGILFSCGPLSCTVAAIIGGVCQALYLVFIPLTAQQFGWKYYKVMDVNAMMREIFKQKQILLALMLIHVQFVVSGDFMAVLYAWGDGSVVLIVVAIASSAVNSFLLYLCYWYWTSLRFSAFVICYYFYIACSVSNCVFVFFRVAFPQHFPDADPLIRLMSFTVLLFIDALRLLVVGASIHLTRGINSYAEEAITQLGQAERFLYFEDGSRVAEVTPHLPGASEVGPRPSLSFNTPSQSRHGHARGSGSAGGGGSGGSRGGDDLYHLFDEAESLQRMPVPRLGGQGQGRVQSFSRDTGGGRDPGTGNANLVPGRMASFSVVRPVGGKDRTVKAGKARSIQNRVDGLTMWTSTSFFSTASSRSDDGSLSNMPSLMNPSLISNGHGQLLSRQQSFTSHAQAASHMSQPVTIDGSSLNTSNSSFLIVSPSDAPLGDVLAKSPEDVVFGVADPQPLEFKVKTININGLVGSVPGGDSSVPGAADAAIVGSQGSLSRPGSAISSSGKSWVPLQQPPPASGRYHVVSAAAAALHESMAASPPFSGNSGSPSHIPASELESHELHLPPTVSADQSFLTRAVNEPL